MMNKNELISNVERAMRNDQRAVEALYNETYAAMYALAHSL